MTTLRGYQQDAVSALWAYFGRSNGNPLIVLPTGSGKSLVLGEVCRRALSEHPTARIVVATHRKELIEQDAAAIRKLWPDAPVGIYSAGLGTRQVRQITVCGIQSVHKRADMFGEVDLLIVDEAHLIPHLDDGMYRRLIGGLAKKSPDLRVIGLTATPFRLSGGLLTRGSGALFQSIAHEVEILPLVEAGYLAPLTTPETSAEYDTSNVRKDGGDFAIGELAAAVDHQEAVTRDAMAEAQAILADRRSVLVFCVSVAHAEMVRGILAAAGHGVDVITGETDPMIRAALINRFRRGELRWLVGVDVLTTGFDAPGVDGIVLLRPTQSTGLYVQILGRGTRIAPGKADCMVLDYGGNIARHGPITDVRRKTQGAGTATASVKECPQCAAEVKLSKRECPECGFIFPAQPREIDHDKKADRAKVMGEAAVPVWVEVDELRASEWLKKGAEVPTVRVDYMRNGRTVVSEWICPQHGGFAGEKAGAWWHRMGGDLPPPHTVALALERIEHGELLEVERVKIGKDGDFPRVVDVGLRERPAEVPGTADDLPF
ncbi:MAG: DEAD/DEAH box helicase [Alphaproteobacteria bacterium]